VSAPSTSASLALVWTSGDGRRRPARLRTHLDGLVVATADHEPCVKLQVTNNAPVAFRIRPIQRGQALARVDIPELQMSVDHTSCAWYC